METIKFWIEVVKLYLLLSVAIASLCGFLAVLFKAWGWIDDDL